MGDISVNLDHRIRLDIEEARLDLPDHNCAAGSFCVSGTVDINFTAEGMEAVNADDEALDDDCVAKFSFKGWGVPVGKEQFDYILTPKGYKVVRDRYIAAINKHKPVYGRLAPDHPRFGTPITIEDVDAAFANSWKQYVANSQKKLNKLKANLKEATNVLKKVL